MPDTVETREEEAPGLPQTIGELLTWIMDQNGYKNLTELASHTSINYKTLYSWGNQTRSAKRPPAADVLRKLATDLQVPEGVVFRAAGRAYSEPGSLDPAALELVGAYKSLPGDDQLRLSRIVTVFTRLAPEQRALAEGALRGIEQAARKWDQAAQKAEDEAEKATS